MALEQHRCQWFGCPRVDTRSWPAWYPTADKLIPTDLCDEHRYQSRELGYVPESEVSE